MISDLMETGWTIQRKTETATDYIVEDTWNDLYTDQLGRMRQLSFTERRSYSKVINEQVYRIYMEYISGLSALTDRIVDPDGQIFSIIGIDDPHNQHEFLQIDAVRGPVEMDDE